MMLPTAPAVYLAVFVDDTLIYIVVKYDCHAVGKLQHSLTVVALWCGYWNIKKMKGAQRQPALLEDVKCMRVKLKLNELLKIM
jgi:hypothetical protein